MRSCGSRSSTKQDPYPIGQRLFMHNERLTDMIVHNLHRRILDKKQVAAGLGLDARNAAASGR